MGFTTWLARKTGEQSPVGDFARDWTSDPERPRATSLAVIEAHLKSKAACDGALRAARRAWLEHQASLGPGAT